MFTDQQNFIVRPFLYLFDILKGKGFMNENTTIKIVKCDQEINISKVLGRGGNMIKGDFKCAQVRGCEVSWVGVRV